MKKLNKVFDKGLKLIETDNYFNMHLKMKSSKINVKTLSSSIHQLISISKKPEILTLLDKYAERFYS